MYNIIKELHSGFRYIAVVLILVAILFAFIGWLGKKEYKNGNRLINLFAMISLHTQLLIGIVLYFVSPYVQFTKGVMKDAVGRYYTVEHWVMMLIAIVLVTIGHSKSKKAVTAEAKYKAIAIFYTIAILVVFVALAHGGIPFFGSNR
ncbi:cytochrome B [Mucilaginibacter myungsuensis]|uniref:Cytochrome B n=1 Tax=Mucilaginibacter myungsuensis TaxID=649104 RepID=A0A929PYD7_9SPHI|nr:cytochrome B [Mucilaginibacter myungsuensis]MBE9664069.1 cytochrome B [Mucilaginibacter myungsuensis]MDN3601247.1 cytochrome B [Mucilaginibacter myungsuensis]